MNHFQNGALLVSSVVCQGWSQASRSAYSLKQSGNLSSVNRSKMAGSLALACATNAGWRRVILLLPPVHRDLSLGDLCRRVLRLLVFCHHLVLSLDDDLPESGGSPLRLLEQAGADAELVQRGARPPPAG